MADHSVWAMYTQLMIYITTSLVSYVQIVIRVFIGIMLTGRVTHIQYVAQGVLACALALPPGSLGQVVLEIAGLVGLSHTLMLIWQDHSLSGRLLLTQRTAIVDTHESNTFCPGMHPAFKHAL